MAPQNGRSQKKRVVDSTKSNQSNSLPTMVSKPSFSVFRLATALLLTGTHALASPSNTVNEDSQHTRRLAFNDRFDSFDEGVWKCEYTCPVIEGGKARFRLQSGVEPDNYGSWSKATYRDQKFTSGRFTVSFSLTSRPEEAVWWGVALWDDGPSDDEFNEINFGYTSDQSYTNTQLRFESAKLGKFESLKVDTGVDLYDEQYHNATLEYDSGRVALYFDGELLQEIKDESLIPADPMELVLGPRLVSGSAPLSQGFTQSIDWVEIEN